MQLTPYLGFDGRCEEAFRLYQSVLGGTLDLRKFGGSPMEDEVPAEWHDRVMHGVLVAEGASLMGSDAPPDRFEPPRGMCVSVQVDDPAEAERIFDALLEGGSVTMPMQTTFWAERFGMLVDRFDIPWIINGGPTA